MRYLSLLILSLLVLAGITKSNDASAKESKHIDSQKASRGGDECFEN